MDKQKLRKEIRARLAETTDKDEQSRAITEKLLACVLPEGSVCIYNSLSSEVNTEGLIKEFFKTREVYLPVVDGDDILLVRLDKDMQYVEAKWGIMEPSGERLRPEDVNPEITVTPLLGADKELNRLGKGKGFYDRYFEKVKTLKIGLAFREQFVEKIPSDEWDKRLDMLVLPDRIIKRQ